MSEPVLYAKRGAIAVVSLNRPRQCNAYNLAMRDALHEIFSAISDDPEVHVVVMRGNGKAFCSGGDLSEFGSAPSPLVARSARWQRDVWGLLRALPQITLAAVHGAVVGGGFEMAMLCDLCLAADDSRFALPETGLGMIPGVGGTQTAPRLLGLGHALDLILSGRWLSAGEALRLGIAARVVPKPHLQRESLALARRIGALPKELTSRLKRSIHEGLDLPLPDALALDQRIRQGAMT